ncbi:hypothetical protein MNEG_11099 [Monoraphidium neglectum]|uniref:Uncharacterized protein n=1 Tax=Monoraphidium neglectum TaxID=145388 RepID=A0A0D2M6K6_9CHLO|nr:hypothetical protein MNEG_11099 [Monoraphidium neglectum]KIY96861.1 hypothetical protein MNEG_11099 [Monoraphidium neglectum]|eukprot:XP_013895881.1 hypothetical protein MNEG_11099 [Monoraphidium neglectum]
MAAWIPLVFEIFGCIIIITLKLIFDHTRLGRRAAPEGARAGSDDGSDASEAAQAAAQPVKPSADACACPHCGRAGEVIVQVRPSAAAGAEAV